MLIDFAEKTDFSGRRQCVGTASAADASAADYFDSQNFSLSREDWKFLLDCLCDGLAPAAFERKKPGNSPEFFGSQPSQVVLGASVKSEVSSNCVVNSVPERAAHLDLKTARDNEQIAICFNKLALSLCQSADASAASAADGSDASAADESTHRQFADASAISEDLVSACSEPSVGSQQQQQTCTSERAATVARSEGEFRQCSSVRHLVATIGVVIGGYIIARYLHLF